MAAARSFLLAAALAALALPAAAQERSGREIARQDCSACHAVTRTDRSRQPEAPAFRTLGERYDVEGLAEALAEGISVGHPMMPEFVYPPDEVHRLIAYLKSLQPLQPNVRRKG
jgi:mono/diheme cytochrome c family protein